MEKEIKVVVVEKDKYFDGTELIGYRLARLALPGDKQGTGGDYNVREGENLFSHSFIKDSYRKIMGRTLTIIDASLIDKQHNKAVKDLLRQVFNDEICFSSEWGYDQKKIQKDLDIDSLDGTEFMSVEDVLGIK